MTGNTIEISPSEAALLSGLASSYTSLFLVDVKNRKFTIIKVPQELEKLSQSLSDSYNEAVNAFAHAFAHPDYVRSVIDYLNLDTVETRLGDKAKIPSLHYRSLIKDREWVQIGWKPGERDEEGHLVSAFITIGEIDPVLMKQQKDLLKQLEEIKELNAHLERTRKEAESANHAKTSFLFNMSHDIRTPMNAIIGFTELLKKHQEEADKRKDYLEKIENSTSVLLSIINNVLEMARIEKGLVQMNETVCHCEQVSDSLYSVMSTMMNRKGITFTRTMEATHDYMYCDITKLNEIFFNILSNACKYTPAGGKVTMDVKELPSEDPEYVLIQTKISDTGIGMSPGFLPHLFDEFARESNSTEAKVEGTGLGMSIVKRLVELLKGTIEVESQQGVGTTFIVTLPHRLAEKPANADHSATQIEPQIFEGKRILLAEDNDLNAEIAIEILSEVGFIVDRATDGLNCVEMMQKPTGSFYTAILMDIQMPHMNGYEATRSIRRFRNPKKANIPIIAMTANAFEEDKREAINAGMNAHLAKPINVPELLKTLAETIK